MFTCIIINLGMLPTSVVSLLSRGKFPKIRQILVCLFFFKKRLLAAFTLAE
jgi:hypothetical protein